MPNDCTGSEGTERERTLVHDLRHCLFALRTGIELLPHLREDKEKFQEIQSVLHEEVRKASVLLKELLEDQARAG